LHSLRNDNGRGGTGIPSLGDGGTRPWRPARAFGPQSLGASGRQHRIRPDAILLCPPMTRYSMQPGAKPC